MKSVYQVDEESLGATMAQTYGMISHVDDCIGRVMDHLRGSGLQHPGLWRDALHAHCRILGGDPHRGKM
ncbi:MAG: hypothetical protein WEB60_09645 [Terrimicrobiaceae bacterium]